MKFGQKIAFVCALLSLSTAGAWPQTTDTYAVVNSIQANDNTTGTQLNRLATVNAAGNAVQATTSNTSVPTYIVSSGAGTSGAAIFAFRGIVPCVTDATIASGANNDFVLASTTTGGDCHAQSAAPSPGTWIVGSLISNSTTAASTALVRAGGYFYSNGGAALYGPPASWIVTMLGSKLAADSNAINLQMLNGPVVSLNFSKLLFQINTADATLTDFYDVGIYGPCAVGASCALVCDLGSGSQGVTETTTGTQDVSCTQATPALTPPPAGQFYFVATTGNASTAQYASPAGNVNIACARSTTNSTNGQLPPTVATTIFGVWSACSTLGPIIALHN